jgi:DNA-directed RNA polymerase III subunit RPC6
VARYTGQEYDLEFIAILRQECQKFIWRNKRATVGATLMPQCLCPMSFMPSNNKLTPCSPSSEELADFVRDSRLSRVTLSEEEVLQIVNTLVYDGNVSAHVATASTASAPAGPGASPSGTAYPPGTVYYTASSLPLKRHSDLTSVPCGVCPVADQCHDGGAISPATCKYYDDWMKLDDGVDAMPAPRDSHRQQQQRAAAAAAAAQSPGADTARGAGAGQHRVHFRVDAEDMET